MGKLIEKYELVKEIKYWFDEIDHPVVAKIYKIILGANAKFTWEIDHYNQLKDEALPNLGGSTFGETVEEVEVKLNMYIKRFEKDGIKVVPK